MIEYRRTTKGRPALQASAVILFMMVGAAQAADMKAGKEKAEICKSCHGPEGISTMPNIPNLAGQTDQYIQYQLVYFRNNQRKNDQMQPMAAGLADNDIRNIGAYIATWPAAKAPAGNDTDKALSEKGKQVVAQHKCATCHGESFTGIQAAPRLALQRADYLEKALKDFRDNGRPSAGVGAMTEAASGLTDDDVKAAAHYLSFFQAPK